MIRPFARLAAAAAVALALLAPATVAANNLPPDRCADPVSCLETLSREVVVQRLMPMGNGTSELITTTVTVGGRALPYLECLVPTPDGYTLSLCLPADAIPGTIVPADSTVGGPFALPPLQRAPLQQAEVTRLSPAIVAFIERLMAEYHATMHDEPLDSSAHGWHHAGHHRPQDQGGLWLLVGALLGGLTVAGAMRLRREPKPATAPTRRTPREKQR